jgi:hypothetical protein
VAILNDALHERRGDWLVSQKHYNPHVKNATIPSIRVRPELRAEIESLLKEEESLSEFVQSAVLASVRHRRDSAEFIQRGLSSLANAAKDSSYVEADELIRRLSEKLAHAKATDP